MKRKLLSLSMLLMFSAGFSQDLLSENFDGTETQLEAAGWARNNQSVPVGTTPWSKSTSTYITYFTGGAYNGDSATSFAFASFNSTTGNNTISNWLMSPVVNLQNGDVISFYTRKGLSGGTTVYADRLQVRLSYNGAASVAPVGNEGLGDYTNLILTINPNLTTTDYPTSWTQYSYTVSGLSAATDARVAFRYYVTSGGPSGANSDYIGLDQFVVNRPLKADEFFGRNFSLYPNPASSVLHLSAKGNTTVETFQITDMNGRLVQQGSSSDVSDLELQVSDLAPGVYFVSVQTAEGRGTSKFVKK